MEVPAGTEGKPHIPAAAPTNNRATFGTWLRPLDFTVTMIGYTVGIHNFWRFPFLCYKFGAVFLIPFVTVMFFMGMPMAFMELTIGQYRGIGPTEVFGIMAPALTGVGYLLAWNSLTTCWIFTMMISWSRLYSNDATSCVQGWSTCASTSYYNTPHCYTGILDMHCENHENATNIHYNFSCVSIQEFCKLFEAEQVEDGGKFCLASDGSTFSIYTRRQHSSAEYYYGGICGMKRVSNHTSDLINQTIGDQRLEVDEASASGADIAMYSFTTFCMLCLFLYEDLLSVSVITYFLNGAPFIALIYFTIRALSMESAERGVEELGNSLSAFEQLKKPEIWVEAVIQILSTSGVGNGVLINLSSFNAYEHSYACDGRLAALLNLVCSICSTIICFCTIGSFLGKHNVGIPFNEAIQSKSSHSSLEFGYIVYTRFLLYLSAFSDKYINVAFLLMITSFSTDSALRLVQNLLDAVVAIFSRLKSHRFATLVGICLFGFVAVAPMTRAGGVILFMDYEYFLLRFVWPFIVLVQVAGVSWVYSTSRILDNAEQMGMNMNKFLRIYYIICLQYICVAALFLVLVSNVVNHTRKRFDNQDSVFWNEIFGWVFVFTPIILFILSVLEQLIITRYEKWFTLLIPVQTEQRPAFVGPETSPSRHKTSNSDKAAKRVARQWQFQVGKYAGTQKNGKSNTPAATHEKGHHLHHHKASTESSIHDVSKDVETKKNKWKDTWVGRRVEKYNNFLTEYFDSWPGRFDESDLSGEDEAN